MLMFTQLKLTFIKLLLLFIVLLLTTISIAQEKEKIDIDSKAKELGITTNELNGLLNSALRNGGSGDPTIDALTDKFFTGQVAGDNFGYSVSTAGDVNGDGYSDMIVGAPYNDTGGNNVGKAYIYFGGTSIDNIADVIMTGEAAGDYFGYSVSTAGDVNGDGYSDVIVGAQANDAGGDNAGRSYIYFGGASMDNNADVTMTGEAADDNFGWSVSTAGDVNGDGYSDVIVGAYQNDAGGASAGRAYIYFGYASMDNNADVIMTGDVAVDLFGYSVSTAGDVNGDGFGDVIVGATKNDAGGAAAGRAYIFFGGTSMDNNADVWMTGEASNDNFGSSVSTAGDVNGDGYSDIIVGAVYNGAGGAGAGRAYIYFGGASMDFSADVIMTGKASNDNFGYSVSTAGDVNGDGYNDVIVGANLNDVGGASAGRAYIYFGGISMDYSADVIMTGEAADDRFGNSVSTAGDVNGDGYSDIIVSAHLNDVGGSSSGRAYIYLNSLTGPDIPDEFFTGEAAVDYFGYSVSTAGDVNGDGYSDIIVGAFNNDSGGSNAGRAYIYFCGTSMDNIADITMTGEAEYDQFGISVSSAGDVNGDGYSDVIVGSQNNDAGGSNAGRAYIYFGGTSMDNGADVTMTGETANDYFGSSVSTAGDVNGDGYSDVIVGAINNDDGGINAGRSYIYFGGTSMDNIADVTMTGEATGDNFGSSVSTARDVNGDGYSDVIVGAYLNDVGGDLAGRAYIYYGGTSMDNIADVTMTGEASNDDFGRSVSTAGDVNGDGYSDVIVGALGNDTGGNAVGRAYIYFGGTSMDNIADVIMTGEAEGDTFGNSVSTAGDVNGDGYSDVIVGAYFNDAGGNSAGRAYIYFGSTSMDNSADVTMTGEAADDRFGNSVSTAGDVNGDGYSDVIVGAIWNYAGGSNAGRSYLYLSSSPPIKPRIMSVKDVPFDQGEYVYVNFVRSGYDARGESNIITEYIIEMSNPPGTTGFSWIQLGTVQPLQNSLYTFIANTPNDSMANNSGTYYLRVTARTEDPNQYWRSNFMYGHSVDNLAPLPPESFNAVLAGGNVSLEWDANLEGDLKGYVLYRTDYPNADPNTLDALAEVTDIIYTDTDPLPGTSYYYLQAEDIHNNLSEPVTKQIDVLLSANIKVYLEELYLDGSMSTDLNTFELIPLIQPFNIAPWNYTGTETVSSTPSGVVDWVLVELRSDQTTTVAKRAGYLKSNGSIADLDGVSLLNFPGVSDGDYYVVIYQRNHMAIMTESAVPLSGSPSQYDFTTNQSQAYGTNAMADLGGGTYGMYSGDSDGSGTVNAGDRSNTWNDRNKTGYYGSDLDLSGTVNAADRSIVWNRRNLSTQVPASTESILKNKLIRTLK